MTYIYAELKKLILTYSHTRLGHNPQIGRPLSRIVVPLVYFFFVKKDLINFEIEGKRGPNLEKVYNDLNTITPASANIFL
jgi:hypothetical protein